MKIMFVSAALAAGLLAQVPAERVAVSHTGLGVVGMDSMMPGSIKGQPYSAEVVTETNQTLADGNRISHRSSAKVARDSQGRTRHETRMNVLGSVKIEGDLPEIVMIHDPGAGATYTLDTRAKTARKMAVHVTVPDGSPVGVIRGKIAHAATVSDGAPKEISFQATAAAPAHFTFRKISGGRAQTESLGVKSIEGVLADGVRITHTIPAAEIGAERDIQIVNEVWTAQDLKAVVYSKRADPRTGEMIYRLTNIQRAEPPANLFEVPADYKLIETLPDKVMMWRTKDD